MTTIMPQSELTRKAIAWIDEIQQSEPKQLLATTLEEAAMRFNLGPKDVEFLNRFYKDNQGEDAR